LNWVKYSFFLFQLSLLQLLITLNPVAAETKSDWRSQRGAHRSNLTAANPVENIPPHHQVSTSAADLLAQSNLTPVTGLEAILKTAAGGQKLVPLILPEGNHLVIDILDATNLQSLSIFQPTVKANWLSMGKFLCCLPLILKRSRTVPGGKSPKAWQSQSQSVGGA
jgi:hypothetical protein